MLKKIINGRTDLVFEFIAKGNPPNTLDSDGVSLLKWCAYYGDVSAIRFLLSQGESLASLGENYDLNGAAFHGHWQLCQFLIEQGASANEALPQTGETPLHNALCTSNRLRHDVVLKVLLANGADPNAVTKPNTPTGSFMRDCRTKAETPLHRAAAFGTAETIDILLAVGAKLTAQDMNGDTPLSWASLHLREDAILRKLCYGEFSIHPQRKPMSVNLTGSPIL